MSGVVVGSQAWAMGLGLLAAVDTNPGMRDVGGGRSQFSIDLPNATQLLISDTVGEPLGDEGHDVVLVGIFAQSFADSGHMGSWIMGAVDSFDYPAYEIPAESFAKVLDDAISTAVVNGRVADAAEADRHVAALCNLLQRAEDDGLAQGGE